VERGDFCLDDYAHDLVDPLLKKLNGSSLAAIWGPPVLCSSSAGGGGGHLGRGQPGAPPPPPAPMAVRNCRYIK